ncbi:pitrilysin family protein [Devosia sp.]|uniref:M16 family metallopeptidase n=1 Tax=Devosia sp. TaxID=1871048 RepID=UPI0025BC9FF7|nr:pitrilysin family protein [Devosia sp.]
MIRTIRHALPALLAPLMLLGFALPSQADVAFKTITSPGGIQAGMVEDYTVPIVTIAFAFEGGAAQDPDDKVGLASLMSSLFDEGAGDLDSNAFQTRLDDVGLEMGFSANFDFFTGFARMLADQREGATELLTLAVNEPRFDQSAIDRMRAQVLAGIASRAQDPGYAAGRMWNETLFGNHPYARPLEGTATSLPEITADDLRGFHKALFARSNLKIGIVGALDAEAAGKMIDAIFGALPADPQLAAIPPAALSFGQNVAVDYPLPQTSINLAYPGIRESDPDYFAADVMTEMLAGNSLVSELNREVREKRGLSYGVSGGLVNLKQADALTIGTSTRPDQSAQAIDVIRSTIGKMIEDGPDPAALERTKRYLVGAYPINHLRSSVAIASTMVVQQLKGLPIDYVDERRTSIEAVTAEDIKRVAERIFSTEPSLLQVGPGAEKAEAEVAP